MITRADKIFAVLKQSNGLTDREITDRVFGTLSAQQSINAECNYQVRLGKITRRKENGLIRNYINNFSSTDACEEQHKIAVVNSESFSAKKDTVKISNDRNIKIYLFDRMFKHVNLQFDYFNKANIFAQLSNKLVSETLEKPRYAKYKSEISLNFSECLNWNIGTFVLKLKENGDARYKCFLNPYGDEEYCKFKIIDSWALKERGLYCYFINDDIKYIGRCRDNFYKRINTGYGYISAKNCYLDGQATNCHINSLINNVGDIVKLYVSPIQNTEEIECAERKLIMEFQPEWNIALK